MIRVMYDNGDNRKMFMIIIVIIIIVIIIITIIIIIIIPIIIIMIIIILIISKCSKQISHLFIARDNYQHQRVNRKMKKRRRRQRKRRNRKLIQSYLQYSVPQKSYVRPTRSAGCTFRLTPVPSFTLIWNNKNFVFG